MDHRFIYFFLTEPHCFPFFQSSVSIDSYFQDWEEKDNYLTYIKRRSSCCAHLSLRVGMHTLTFEMHQIQKRKCIILWERKPKFAKISTCLMCTLHVLLLKKKRFLYSSKKLDVMDIWLKGEKKFISITAGLRKSNTFQKWEATVPLPRE